MGVEDVQPPGKVSCQFACHIGDVEAVPVHRQELERLLVPLQEALQLTKGGDGPRYAGEGDFAVVPAVMGLYIPALVGVEEKFQLGVGQLIEGAKRRAVVDGLLVDDVLLRIEAQSAVETAERSRQGELLL